MRDYILRRLLLMIPTLIGIILINFIIVQWAPGGPVEQMMAEFEGHSDSAMGRIGASGAGDVYQSGNTYRGAEGLKQEMLDELRAIYGFDKPAHERFIDMMVQYLKFDFGESFYHDKSVIDLVIEKLPVSISLGLWSTLIIYLVSIPLGIYKAVKDGTKFDVWSSSAIVIGYAIPGFMFAVLLIVLFAGGKYLDIFPLRGLTSPEWETFSVWHQITDYLWHITLPVIALTIGGFAGLTMLTKNSFLDEIHKQYVVTAAAKGLQEREILYKHVFRNAMLIVIAGFPAAFLGIFLSGSVLIEVIFSLDGLGLLGFESIVNRNYPVVFATLYIFTIIGLIFKLIADLMYVWVDPRISFAGSR